MARPRTASLLAPDAPSAAVAITRDAAAITRLFALALTSPGLIPDPVRRGAVEGLAAVRWADAPADLLARGAHVGALLARDYGGALPDLRRLLVESGLAALAPPAGAAVGRRTCATITADGQPARYAFSLAHAENFAAARALADFLRPLPGYEVEVGPGADAHSVAADVATYRRCERLRRDGAFRGRIEPPPQLAAAAPAPRHVRLVGAGAGDRLAFHFGYEADVIAALRVIPGTALAPVPGADGAKAWVVPGDGEAVAAAMAVARRFGFDVPPGVAAFAERATRRAELALALSQSHGHGPEGEPIPGVAVGSAEHGAPLPYQWAGARYVVEHGSTIIADEMGLGKSLQALLVAEAAGAARVLVVCPASLKLNWAREVAMWLPHRADDIAVVQGTDLSKRRRRPLTVRAKNMATGEVGPIALHVNDLTRSVVVVNYDVLAAHEAALSAAGFDLAVFDEGHYLRNGQTKRGRAARRIARGVPLRLLLTGTPVVNRPADLVHQLQVIGKLEAVSPKGVQAFRARYCDLKSVTQRRRGYDVEVQDDSGASNLGELHGRLRQTCLVRRRKADVLTELPPKRRVEVAVDMAEAKWEEYERARRDLVAWVGERAAEQAAFEAALAGLSEEAAAAAARQRQQARSEAAMRAEALVRLGALKRIAAEGKLPALKDWLDDFIEGDQKLVAFAASRWMQDALVAHAAERLGPGGSAAILAEHSAEERQAAVDAFQADPAVRLVVCSLRAASVGLTLTAASDVLFAEVGWTPAEHDQAEDRCHRIGQAGSVTAWYPIVSGSIEDDVVELIEKKRRVAAQALDGAAADGADLVDELLARLALPSP